MSRKSTERLAVAAGFVLYGDSNNKLISERPAFDALEHLLALDRQERLEAMNEYLSQVQDSRLTFNELAEKEGWLNHFNEATALLGVPLMSLNDRMRALHNRVSRGQELLRSLLPVLRASPHPDAKGLQEDLEEYLQVTSTRRPVL